MRVVMTKSTQLLIALFLGLGLRLTLAIATQGNYDLRSYEIVSAIVRSGGNVYAETNRYNYTPLWSFVLAFPINVRVFLSCVDILNAILISHIANHRAGIFYALNPVSVLLVGYGGQFETLAALPILLALYLKKGAPLLCALAIIIKHDLIFIAWCVLIYRYGWRRAGIVILAIMAAFLATFLPYRDAMPNIIRNVFLYQSIPNVYGFGLISHYAIVGLLALMPFVPLVSKWSGYTLWQALVMTVLAQFVLMPGFGDQYWVLLPLFAFEPSAWRTAVIWSLAGLILLLPWSITAEWNLVPYVPRLMNIGWVLSMGWLIVLITKSKHRMKLQPTIQSYTEKMVS